MDTQDSLDRLATSRRILVLGSSGSGKTTFSIRLGHILNLDTIHLDAEFWKKGWVATPQPEWRTTVARLIQRESWIMDGTYESTLHLRIPAADTLIVIECSRWVCLWRVMKRRATVDDHRRPDAPSGQTLSRAFLRYVWRYPAVTQPDVLNQIQQYGPDKTVIKLRGSSAIEHYLQRLERVVVDRQNQG